MELHGLMNAGRWALLALVCAVGCDDPPVDDFRPEGAAPEPTGVIEGTVLYAGPRPVCVTTEDRGRVPLGRVILTLFLNDNPPPPEGSAASAANLLTIPGSELFSTVDDCMPDDPTPAERREFITRSADFVWPEIPLGHGAPVSYQIRAYYDYDQDFNPFFSVSNLPTAGDVAGGALVDPTAAVTQFRAITFGAEENNPLGQVVGGIAVSLGAPVVTERPIFSIATGPLSSEATIPLEPDPAVSEGLLYANTNTVLSLYEPGTDEANALNTALTQGGLAIDLETPFSYAWYVRGVDANRDGETDLHPILETRGVTWTTPILLFQRVQNEIEAAAGVPSALLIGSTRPTQTLFKKVFYPDIEMVVPPVAAVQTAPDDRCLIPYIPPNNVTDLLERITVDCQELPTGRYAVNVLHGIAAGLPIGGGVQSCDPEDSECPSGTACIDNVCVAPSALSDTGWEIQGGQFSSQAWSIPNALGDPAQIDDPVPEQGVASLFVVQDEDVDPTDPRVGRLDGRDGCEMALDPAMMAPRTVEYTDFSEHGDSEDEVREICCAPIRHLCDVPLCAPQAVAPDDPDGPQMYGQPTEATVDAEGRTIPNCLSFLMPAACCM